MIDGNLFRGRPSDRSDGYENTGRTKVRMSMVERIERWPRISTTTQASAPCAGDHLSGRDDGHHARLQQADTMHACTIRIDGGEAR
ncbi:hypothetical protein [Streptomyces nitrosporeus]|uniref:hypothetical protein n=1 Tax=Streptomyces nitrosporeus TaxID=28894 RepID=UPI0039A2F3DD